MSAAMNRKRYGSALRIYDNGGRTPDRYTILPPRDAGADYRENGPGTWSAISASAHPFHPQGFGQHCSAAPGSRNDREPCAVGDARRAGRQRLRLGRKRYGGARMNTLTDKLAAALRAGLTPTGNLADMKRIHAECVAVLAEYDARRAQPPRYTAESYAASLADGTVETGWCVKYDGEDIVCDVRTETEARTLAALLNGAEYDAQRDQNAGPKEVPVCAQCGSTEVAVEVVSAYWIVSEQDWEVSDICAKGHYCHHCGRETRLMWRPATPEEIES